MATEPELSLDAVRALSARLLQGGSLDDLLRHVCTTVVEQLPGADEASVSLVCAGEPTTYGATSGLPVAADERQYEVDGGPCLDAARGNQVVIVHDARTDDRWRDALRAIAAEGVLSSLSLPLPVQGEAIGALNVYAKKPDAFGAEHVELGQRLASFAAVVVANAVAYESLADTARNMQLAMESRSVIEQAKGIIMARTACDVDKAFQLLVQQSQHENRKLREIATELVERASNGPA